MATARVVHKYPFGASNHTGMEVPAGDVVLVAAQQPSDALPTVWIEYDAEHAFITKLTIRGTGQPIEEALHHVGSAVCADGALVWHVYEDAS